MPTVSRRGLLVLGGTGAAGAVLAACGETADLRADASQGELTQGEFDAELALSSAYALAAGTRGSADERSALDDFAAAAEKRADQLRAFAPDPGTEVPAPDGGPDSAEALSAVARLANAAIAAHNAAAGLLDSIEGRALASSALAACAAELAAVNHFDGKPEAPNAFVTGGAQKPYEATDEPDDSDSETTSTTESSSTTAESSSTTEEP
jgi:hypothetical protein